MAFYGPRCMFMCTSDRKGAMSNSRKPDGRNKQTIGGIEVFVNCRRYCGASACSSRQVCTALKTILSDTRSAGKDRFQGLADRSRNQWRLTRASVMWSEGRSRNIAISHKSRQKTISRTEDNQYSLRHTDIT